MISGARTGTAMEDDSLAWMRRKVRLIQF